MDNSILTGTRKPRAGNGTRTTVHFITRDGAVKRARKSGQAQNDRVFAGRKQAHDHPPTPTEQAPKRK
jgi:hypothetical protein